MSNYVEDVLMNRSVSAGSLYIIFDCGFLKVRVDII